jgi:hypothetical protein
MFHVKHDALFSELRSICQRAPSRTQWFELLRLIRPLEGEALERFSDELAPYLRGALSHWPDVVRVAHPLDDPDHVFSVARVLELDARSRKEDTGVVRIGRSAARWASPCCDHIIGFHVRGISSNLDLLFHELVTVLRGLERVHLSGHIDTSYRRDPETTLPHTALAYVELLATHHASTLRHVGIGELFHGGHADASQATWEALFDRFEAFPELRSLCVYFGRGQKHVVTRLMTDPALDHIEEFSFCSRTHNRDVLALAERAASTNLERVRIMPIREADAQELIRAPNLSGVTCWELEPQSYDTHEVFVWGSERSKYLATLSPFISTNDTDDFDTRWLDLTPFQPGEVRRILFEPDGTMRRFERVEGLLVPSLKSKDLRDLLKQAHEGMPNLRKLVFDLPAVFRPIDFRALSASALVDRLDLFWSRPSYLTTSGTHTTRTTSEDRQEWLALARDPDLHLAVRAHAWRRATFAHGLTSLRHAATAFGLSTSGRPDADTLRTRIDTLRPADLDLPDAGALDGDLPGALDPRGAIAEWRRAYSPLRSPGAHR